MAESRDEKPLPPEPPTIPAEQLFGDRREVWIEYHGERYKLRITRRGKLMVISGFLGQPIRCHHDPRGV